MNWLRLLAHNLTIIRLISFNIIFCFRSQARADSKAIEKEKLELEEHFACLNEKYSICEQSLCTAQENISSLELTLSALQAEIQQFKLHLETSSTELSAVRTSFKLLILHTFLFVNHLCRREKKRRNFKRKTRCCVLS